MYCRDMGATGFGYECFYGKTKGKFYSEMRQNLK
jgi:hypothetical protein